MAWLLDLMPPDYRQHSVLRTYLLALATLARHHVRACLDGARRGYRTTRTDLGRLLEPLDQRRRQPRARWLAASRA